LARLERSSFDEARALLEETRALASEGESPRFEAIAWTLIGWLEARAGRTDEAERSFVRAERATGPRGDPWPEMVIASIRAQLELRRGRLTLARRGLERARALAVRVGDGANEASACGFLGGVAYDEGALREAVRHYDRAMAIAAAAQASMPAAIFSGYRAITLHELGDLGAKEAYDEALARTRRAHSPRFEGLFTAWRGVLVAQQGLLDEAADAMSRAESLADGWQPAAIVSLHRGHLDLAEARGAEDPGDAQRHLALAARRLADVPRVEGEDVTRELRIAHRFLARVLRAHEVRGPRAQLTVGWQGQWIEAGGARIELGTHRAQRRLVWELALRRLIEPGVPADADALIATAWPEERLLPDAATHRLRVALSTLRRRGLGDVIQTTGEGYRLDPKQALALAADDRAAPRPI
jgi:tetratricopeptide (TPR) repeat protein